MKTKVTNMEAKGGSVVVHLEGDVGCLRGGPEPNPAGVQAMRILYGFYGKVRLEANWSNGKALVTVVHPRKLRTNVPALQAEMDKLANARLKVANFRTAVVNAGTPRKAALRMKSPQDVEKFWREHPKDGTVMVTRDVRLNLPVLIRDGAQLDGIMRGLHCSTWSSDRSLDIDVLRLSVYQPNPLFEIPRTDPWELMKGLEQKIRTAIRG